ncbi:MAG: glycerate kinase [Microcella sp.]
MTRVVVAPDSFKGTITAGDAATALAAGWRSVRADDELVLRPMADGGEGTLDAIAAATPEATRVPVTVTGPDDRPVETHWLLLPDGSGVVELALTSGLTLLDELRPWSAHTIGFGEAIAAALDHGVARLVLAIGGSATTDGGTGMLAALGARFSPFADTHPRGPADVERITGVELSALRALPRGGVLALTDVDSPLTGKRGAAAVFGPQKGLVDPEAVERADAALRHLATLIAAAADGAAPADPATQGSGAAGGTGFGLLVWGATLSSGAAAVADTVGLDAALTGADLLITGEGRFDGQTAAGKVAHEASCRADALGVPRALVAGAIEAEPAGFGAAVSLAALAGTPDAAMAEPARWLHAAGFQLAQTL